MTSASDKTVSGLGPHGERAAAPSRITLLDHDIAAARESGFSVAIVIHTLHSDWSQQSMAGIVKTLDQCGATVSEVVNCEFDGRPDRRAGPAERRAGRRGRFHPGWQCRRGRGASQSRQGGQTPYPA